MRLLKQNSLLGLVNSYVVDSPQPANLSYAWNFGSLLATCLGIQIVTGIILAMHYTPNVDLAFVSVEHIMRDVNYGWMIRYIHANVASFFFIFVYLHIGRGLYYGSYKSPRVLPWSIGVIILVLMMGVAFLGFSLNSPKWLYIITPDSFSCMSALPVACSPRLQAILAKHNLTPLAVWENLQVSNVKAAISAVIKSIAGVYCIINLKTGEMYVGSAISGKMPNRLHKHLFGGSGSILVWNAVRQHGLSYFAFVVLGQVPGTVTAEDNSNLLEMEQHFINTLLPVYNIAPNAGNTFGVKHTAETRAKMVANYSSERREMIGSLNRNKSLASSTVEKIRAAALLRPAMSVATRELVSLNSANAKLFSITRVNGDSFLSPEGIIVTEVTLRTIPTVSSFLNCSTKTVQRALRANGIVSRIWYVSPLGLANG